jgi:hypothetical protein
VDVTYVVFVKSLQKHSKVKIVFVLVNTPTIENNGYSINLFGDFLSTYDHCFILLLNIILPIILIQVTCKFFGLLHNI